MPKDERCDAARKGEVTISVVSGGNIVITGDGNVGVHELGMEVGEPEVSARKSLGRLRQILTSRFDEGELRTLCFDLGVDYDSFPGTSKANKARELIAYLARRGHLPDLVRTGKMLRPDVSWVSSDDNG